MCSPTLRLLKIADEVFHCQLGLCAKERYERLIKSAGRAMVREAAARGLASAGGSGTQVSRAFARGIDVNEQRLLRPRNAEHILSHLDQGRGYAFLRPR